MSATAFIFMPQNNPASDNLGSKQWDKKVSDIVDYRGACRRVEIAGVYDAWLGQRGAADEFNYGDFSSSDELNSMLLLAREYPGAYAALWSYGHVFTIACVDSRDGKWETAEFSFRLNSVFRDEGKLPVLIKWLEALRIPFSDDLRALLEAPQIELREIFAAFGFKKVRNLKDRKSQQVWEAFEQWALLTLAGDPRSGEKSAELESLLPVIAELDEEDCLRDLDRPGARSRLVGERLYELQECFGEVPAGHWKQRLDAAAWYWDITDCQASEKLIYCEDEEGVGNGAAMGRLLAHYPRRLMRDSLFLSQAGLEAEGANGHYFVELFAQLAESISDSGFSLAVYPADSDASLMKQFDLGAWGQRNRPGEWCAEAFVDINGRSAQADLLSWFEKSGDRGVLLRCEADGAFELKTFGGLALEADAEQIEAAGRDLWPRACLAALGFEDLLEPGEWYVGAYSGMSAEERDEYEQQFFALAAEELKFSGESRELSHFNEFFSSAGDYLHPEEVGDDEYIFYRLTLPAEAVDLAANLAVDLTGKGLLGDYGKCLQQGSVLLAYQSIHMSAPMMARQLNDLPPGSQLEMFARGVISRSLLLKGEYVPLELHLNLPLSTFDEFDEDEEMFDELDDFDAMFNLQPLFPQRPDLASGVSVDCDLVRDIVYEGTRLYYKLDLSGQELGPAERLAEIDEEFAAAGFKCAGDLVCDQFAQIVLRAYLMPGAGCTAVVMMQYFGPPIVELFTLFVDETSLTTTSNALSAESGRKQMNRLPEKTPVVQMLASHTALLEAQSRRIEVQPDDLESFCRAVEWSIDAAFG